MLTATKNNNYKGALQKPLHSGFSASSTAMEVISGIDLYGKPAIVTGGYAGIGLETVKALSKANALIWEPARDPEKATKNLAGISNVTVKQMDLMDPASIERFVSEFITSGNPLHLLINNAGIMWVPLRRDSRGHESQLATNHLGHFQLTALLWPALKHANEARVVNVSSFGHQIAPFNFDDPDFLHREYETLQGYGQSKTANYLFSVELDFRGKEFGVRAYSLHPGAVHGTDLGREAPMALFQQMGTHDQDGNLKPEVALKLKTTPQGAATTVWCATSPQLNNIGGVYCEDCDIAEPDLGNIEHKYDEPATLRGVKPYSVDGENAQRLWKMREAFPENIANLKISEAISILRVIEPSIDGMPTNFSDPGKLDLADFMERTLCSICLWRSLVTSPAAASLPFTATSKKPTAFRRKNGCYKKDWSWRIT